MTRNKRILVGICLTMLIGLLLFLGTRKQATWQMFPRNSKGFPVPNVLLINGERHDLHVYDGQKQGVKQQTISETIAIKAEKSQLDWEFVFSNTSPVQYWFFQDEGDTKYCEKRVQKSSVVRQGEKIIGQLNSLVIYTTKLERANDTVLHFYYYNIKEREKPINERHANYHLQIKLEFKSVPAAA